MQGPTWNTTTTVEHNQRKKNTHLQSTCTCDVNIKTEWSAGLFEGFDATPLRTGVATQDGGLGKLLVNLVRNWHIRKQHELLNKPTTGNSHSDVTIERSIANKMWGNVTRTCCYLAVDKQSSHKAGLWLDREGRWVWFGWERVRRPRNDLREDFSRSVKKTNTIKSWFMWWL